VPYYYFYSPFYVPYANKTLFISPVFIMHA